MPSSLSLKTGEMAPLEAAVGTTVDADFSPDGTKIVYSGVLETEISVANANGTGAVVLCGTGAHNPSFSPDGQQVIFSHGSGTACEISRVNVDGTGLTQLTDLGPAWDAQHPVYSHDGTKIAFVRCFHSEYYIDLMDSDGSDRVTLCHPPDAPIGTRIWGPPTFSPDDTKLVYATDWFSTAGHPQLVQVNVPDGGGRTCLTRADDAFTHPVFSPDGGTIIALRVLDDGAATPHNLFRIPLTGNRMPIQITHQTNLSFECSRVRWVE